MCMLFGVVCVSLVFSDWLSVVVCVWLLWFVHVLLLGDWV